MPLSIPRHVFLATAVAAVLAISATTAAAQDRTYRFELPRQSLAQTLRDYGQIAGQQIVFTEALVEGRSAPELRGTYTAEEALERLLEASGLTTETNADGVIMIRRGVRAPGAATTGEVVRTEGRRVGKARVRRCQTEGAAE